MTPVKSLRIEVFGDPIAQGSKRAFVVKGKAILTESAGGRLKTWRSEIVSAARDQLNGDGPMTGPVRVTLFFWVRQPKRSKNALPIVRPDVDKLERAILDSLVAAGVMRDDAQVTTISSRKRYGDPPRCVIAVAEDG